MASKCFHCGGKFPTLTELPELTHRRVFPNSGMKITILSTDYFIHMLCVDVIIADHIRETLTREADLDQRSKETRNALERATRLGFMTIEQLKAIRYGGGE